jgi:hypothetical protein
VCWKVERTPSLDAHRKIYGVDEALLEEVSERMVVSCSYIPCGRTVAKNNNN